MIRRRRQLARLITTWAASGSNQKLNSAFVVTFPSAAELPPITKIVSKREPKLGSAITQVARVVKGPIATILISPIKIKYLQKNR